MFISPNHWKLSVFLFINGFNCINRTPVSVRLVLYLLVSAWPNCCERGLGHLISGSHLISFTNCVRMNLQEWGKKALHAAEPVSSRKRQYYHTELKFKTNDKILITIRICEMALSLTFPRQNKLARHITNPIFAKFDIFGDKILEFLCGIFNFITKIRTPFGWTLDFSPWYNKTEWNRFTELFNPLDHIQINRNTTNQHI